MWSLWYNGNDLVLETPRREKHTKPFWDSWSGSNPLYTLDNTVFIFQSVCTSFCAVQVCLAMIACPLVDRKCLIQVTTTPFITISIIYWIPITAQQLSLYPRHYSNSFNLLNNLMRCLLLFSCRVKYEGTMRLNKLWGWQAPKGWSWDRQFGSRIHDNNLHLRLFPFCQVTSYTNGTSLIIL